MGFEIAGDVPGAAWLRLRGRSVLLRRIEPSDLSITVDCSLVEKGTQTIQLSSSMVEAPLGAEVVDITPAEISFSLMTTSPQGPPRK
jgi:hypothetical protein